MKQKIETSEQYYSLVKDVQASAGKLFHNAYFLPEFLEGQIRQGLVSCFPLKDALLIFFEYKDYRKVYFHASAKAISELADTGSCQSPDEKTCAAIWSLPEDKKPLLSSLIGTVSPDTLSIPGQAGFFPPENIPPRLKPSISFLENLGMCRADCYYHMSANSLHKPVACDFSGFSIAAAEEEQIPSILPLLFRSFPPLTSDLPEEQELRSLVRRGEAFLLRDASGAIRGYCQYEAQGNKRMLRHLVITPEYRGRHLSDAFLQYFSRHFPENPSFLWVKEDNAAASSLYHSWGYHFDGRILINYTLE